GFVKGWRERAGQALVTTRAARVFASAGDLAARVGLTREEMATLATIGALAPLGGTRRANLWTVAEQDPGPLFAASDEKSPSAEAPLREMSADERLTADYAGTGVTLGPHPMALRRAALAARGVTRAIDLSLGDVGARVRIACCLIVS